MSDQIRDALHKAHEAVDEVNAAFGAHLQELQRSGNPAEAQRWKQATQAMRDSGVIYLSWAAHYAKSVGIEVTEADELDAEFMDEGGDFNDPRLPA